MSVLEITPDVQVRKAVSDDAAAVSAILAAAFHDDPVGRWLIPDEARRRRLFPELFRLYFDAYLPHEEVHVNQAATGAALWLPAGRELLDEEQGERFGAAISELAGPDAERFFTLEEVFAAHLPEEPHLHLQLLAVRPERQGRGIGSALMAPVLERADRDGVPAYLEATSERNRALYERYGFAFRGPVPLPGGPALHAMWRDPR
jgi:ribosomal protein S18 acetylase RimI-like enzyme